MTHKNGRLYGKYVIQQTYYYSTLNHMRKDCVHDCNLYIYLTISVNLKEQCRKQNKDWPGQQLIWDVCSKVHALRRVRQHLQNGRILCRCTPEFLLFSSLKASCSLNLKTTITTRCAACTLVPKFEHEHKPSTTEHSQASFGDILETCCSK